MDIHQQITDRIVATLEAGQAGTWTCPWHRKAGGGLPRNALTTKPYRGINILSLWVAEQVSGYSDSRWATYRQWSEIGAQVRKGEKATLVVFYKEYAAQDADGKDEKRFVAMASFAFNADQVDGAPATGNVPAPSTELIIPPDFERFVSATGAAIRHGGETACYVPSLDEIRMPERTRFHTAHGYASTVAHELTHWTGAKTRLDRDLTGRFKTSAYAAEELVAELGSAFTMATLGMASEPHPQHASYIAHWITLLKSDSKAIFTAAAAASKAVDFLTRETG